MKWVLTKVYINDNIFGMPAVHPRTVAREEEAALTATITESRHARIASGSYTELDLQQAIGSTNMAAIEAVIGGDTTSTRQIDDAWKLRALVRELNELATLPMAPRTNPRAQSMARHGRKYVVRKDHGTKASRQQIAAGNDTRNSRVKGSNSQKRRASKLRSRSGNPRIVAKLQKLGDLLV